MRKQKRTRDLFEKTENGSVGNTLAKGENTFCPKALTKNGSRGEKERLTGGGGSHPSGLKTPATLAGARRLRWSPASNHGEAERLEGTKRFRVFFRVGGWWTWPSESTTSTATFSGGRWFGRWWSTPVGAANSKLKRGSAEWMHKEATGKR